jgi:hypothetical protein
VIDNYYAYTDEACGKTCLVHVWYGALFDSCRSIQNSRFPNYAHGNSMYSGNH